eukprot:649016-Pelagomonas_calceolata.AAC.3
MSNMGKLAQSSMRSYRLVGTPSSVSKDRVGLAYICASHSTLPLQNSWNKQHTCARIWPIVSMCAQAGRWQGRTERECQRTALPGLHS